MIALAPVLAIVLRHIRVLKSDINLFLIALYWPLLDIIIWGFLGRWIGSFEQSDLPNYQAVALLGVLLWQIVGRGMNQMVLTLTEELYSTNIVNLFSLPIKITEWIIGSILFVAIMCGVTAFFSMLAIFILYDVSMIDLISTFLIFALPLFISTIGIGSIALIAILLLGKRGVEISFVIGWFLMPFSGACYPIEILPAWGQTFSRFFPMSYVFQAMRQYVMYQQDPTRALLIGCSMSIFYAAASLALFFYFFQYSKRKGLARLTD